MPSERETAFPQLTDAQIDLLRPGARVRDVKAGDVLFAEGDRGFSFYVVLDGAVEIIEHSRGVAHTVACGTAGSELWISVSVAASVDHPRRPASRTSHRVPAA